MDTVSNWITFFCSTLVATFISLLTFYFDIVKHKKDLIAQAITSNRIDWIMQMRTLVAEFICAYIDQRPTNELQKIKIQIQLMCRHKVDYDKILECIDTCCKDTENVGANCDALIEVTQYVLQKVWVRIKIEGGQTAKDEIKIRKQVDDWVKLNGM